MALIRLGITAAAVLLVASQLHAAASRPATKPTTRDTSRGDQMLRDYFRNETAIVSKQCLAEVKTLDDWNAKKEQYRRQFAEMLGLWPMPERTELKAVVTGKVDHPEFTVERVQFQSRPGLYVTANLYVPKELTKPAPAILYVCGHGPAKDPKTGISFGNKTSYQHHGAWFARNGYVCLIPDTLQMGEIEGIYHGLYRERMWWWLSRGYTPAGVEAWNGIRCLDYLQSRPEVDGTRIGMTGRSGGGAYTWWVAALDERVKVAVPVAGMTDLQNHVVDGCVEGHCDCMFMVNTYRWDYAQVAALIAPRPLLIGNSDKDIIFPLDGVYRLHEQVRRIYKLNGAEKNLGLLITEGPHKDTQELQVPAFRWFNRFLKGEDAPIEKVATKFFQPDQLRVFEKNPDDQHNTKIQEDFVPAAPAPVVPESAAGWAKQRDAWLTALREKTFHGWPGEQVASEVHEAFSVVRQGIRLSAYDFTSQHDVRLRLYVARADSNTAAELAVLNVLDEAGWAKWLAEMRVAFATELGDVPSAPGNAGTDDGAFEQTTRMLKSQKWVMAWLAPRGVGATAWAQDEKSQTHIRRRFALLGQTVEGMQVWDTMRASDVLGGLAGMRDVPRWLQAEGRMAGVALYAAALDPKIARLDLWSLPTSHRDGPDLLNVMKTMDMPAAVVLAAEHAKVRIYTDGKADWSYPIDVAAKLGWGADRVQVRAVPSQHD